MRVPSRTLKPAAPVHGRSMQIGASASLGNHALIVDVGRGGSSKSTIGSAIELATISWCTSPTAFEQPYAEAVRGPVWLGDEQVTVAASLGVSLVESADARGADVVLASADERMYEAKRRR